MSAARPANELSLLFADPQGHPAVFPIPQGTTTIGRAPDNDLVLEHPSVEPHQLVLLREGEEIELRDLFAGETRVNDELRRAGSLQTGDVLALGEVRLRLMRIAPRPGQEPGTSGTRRWGGRSRATARRGGTARSSRSDATPSLPISAPSSGATRSPTPSSPPSSTGALPEAPPAPDPQPAHPTAAGAAGKPEPARDSAAAEEALLARERDARRARALARARQLADELMVQDDFEVILERLAEGFLDVFTADRAVAVLFEEDGRNPILTVERRQEGTDEGTGVAQEIIDRCLQVRAVIRVAGGLEGLGGLAAPLITRGRALGLLYFERNIASGQALGADDVHLLALLTNVSALLIAPLVS